MNIKKALLPLALAATLGVSACGGDDNDSGTGGSGGSATTSEPTATPTPAAAIDDLTGNRTSVELDAGFVEALDSLNVTPGAVGDGRISDAGVASFPITGGNVQYYGPDSGVNPYVQGMIEHDGSGLSLTAGGTEVELTDFVVDPGTSTLTGTVSVDGTEAAASAPLFFLDGNTLQNPPTTDEAEGTVTLTGTTVKLKQEAADLLNQTFGIEDLEGGLVIGIATIEAKLPAS